MTDLEAIEIAIDILEASYDADDAAARLVLKALHTQARAMDLSPEFKIDALFSLFSSLTGVYDGYIVQVSHHHVHVGADKYASRTIDITCTKPVSK